MSSSVRVLGFQMCRFECEPEERKFLGPAVLSLEPMIDGVCLSVLLGVSRTSLAYLLSSIDLASPDSLFYSKEELLGRCRPINQFQTNRIVLYGCHCGYDYCGVISFELVIADDQVIWQSIGHEDDDGVDLEQNYLPQLCFAKEQYFQAVQSLDTHCQLFDVGLARGLFDHHRSRDIRRLR